MNTFLPYPSFWESAQVLDSVRLRNQANRECLTLWRGGWSNHPAAKMWCGYRPAFEAYWLAVGQECLNRGYKWTNHGLSGEDFISPWWLGNPLLHASHRANLLRKDPEHYGQFGWSEAPMNGYWWPDKPRMLRLVQNGREVKRIQV